jgi:hypothetical protein
VPPAPRRALPIGLSTAVVTTLLCTATITASALGARAFGARDAGQPAWLEPGAKLSGPDSSVLHMFAASSSAQQARPAQAGVPVSTGSCTLIAPQTFRIIDRGRAKKGRDAITYYGLVGAKCNRAVQSVYCYGEIWRRRDFKVIGNKRKFGEVAERNVRRCVVDVRPVPPTYYAKPTTHWTKAAIIMKAPPGAFWGSGQGPEGWACHGQGTRDLSCVRSSAPKD